MRLYHYQSLKAKPPHLPRQSPGEIKRREVSWTLTKKLAQKRSRGERWCWARERVGLRLLQLFPNGGATDIVFVNQFCTAVETAIAWCCGRCAMPDGHCHNILCSGGGPRQPWSSRLAPVSRFHSSVPFSHSSPSLMGLLASVTLSSQTLPRL